MARWIAKTLLQRGISCLPRAYWWNALFQKYVAKSYHPDRRTLLAKLACCARHYDHYLRHASGAGRNGFTVLELGTGPWPIVPIGLYLLGARRILSYEIRPFLRRDSLRSTLELLAEAARDGTLAAILPAIDPARELTLHHAVQLVFDAKPEDVLATLGMEFHIGDARHSGLPDASIDFVFSTVVLEHIPKPVLAGLLQEFRRVLRADGVMSHYIGLEDQYAGFDPSITPFNFLQYEDWQWNLLNNPIIPLHRLRLPDFREIMRASGFEIVEEDSLRGEERDLQSIRLASRFRDIPTEDLLALYAWLVCRPVAKV